MTWCEYDGYLCENDSQRAEPLCFCSLCRQEIYKTDARAERGNEVIHLDCIDEEIAKLTYEEKAEWLYFGVIKPV